MFLWGKEKYEKANNNRNLIAFRILLLLCWQNFNLNDDENVFFENFSR
jgi:hypothetical protein